MSQHSLSAEPGRADGSAGDGAAAARPAESLSAAPSGALAAGSVVAFNLSYNSYAPSFGGQFSMRLCLGGLLGVIGGIMFSFDQAELETYSLSVVIVAFLMGYSVEFAFTLFDRLIERGRSLFTPQVRSSETPTVEPPATKP